MGLAPWIRHSTVVGVSTHPCGQQRDKFMEIRIASLLEGAREAEGTVVVIDVLRAFTTAAIALARGAEKLLLVATPDEARRLREDGQGDLCVGEVGGRGGQMASISGTRPSPSPRPTCRAKP